MPTFLFDSIVFGPVRSRRLGVSLGINLLPADRKVCSFNCIYCECGWTTCTTGTSGSLPLRSEVREALRKKLSEMKARGEKPDVITYAGNGEPTLHPDFSGIIDDSIALRDELFPEARISVLSNGSAIHRKPVREALMRVDMNIQKLDSALASTRERLNQPNNRYDYEEFKRWLVEFKGRFIIQTLFVRGSYQGEVIDNTTPEEIEAWLAELASLRPASVMIYTIERDTPLDNELKKVPLSDLKAIAARVTQLGIPVSVSG
ncbi:MAG: radical SAM protein [Bacteroidales bacterium]|nr:radical SAM protein [Bacteroidales bacterium]